ncbi:IS5 family transposase [Streptomyces sp. NPDC051243]|uniref:IS5 family transposase n=1 Tax=Streptomyces sp. NPDC051243 TaxID=3365646 RepID=UPI0037A4F1FD
MRPSEEYRTPTDEEWNEFLGHFERRKVAPGDCGRAYGASCQHEHSCVRCPLLARDGLGRPLAIMLTAGRRHDGVCARPLLERIRVPRLGRGRPRCGPDHVVADKAYASRGFRAYLRKRGISHTIPEKQDQQRHRRNRGRGGGRPPRVDRVIYHRRNTVERRFNRLKSFPGIATRYDKTATSYEAAVSLASLLLWARSV